MKCRWIPGEDRDKDRGKGRRRGGTSVDFSVPSRIIPSLPTPTDPVTVHQVARLMPDRQMSSWRDRSHFLGAQNSLDLTTKPSFICRSGSGTPEKRNGMSQTSESTAESATVARVSKTLHLVKTSGHFVRRLSLPTWLGVKKRGEIGGRTRSGWGPSVIPRVWMFFVMRPGLPSLMHPIDGGP